MFGYEVSFFSEEALAILIDEVFVQNPYLFQSSRSDPLIVDCGANIGMSVLFFKHLYPDAEILAFEPDPLTFAVLQANVATNRLSRVRLFNKAVDGVEGLIPFFYSPTGPGNLGMTTRAGGPLTGQRNVEAVTLSSYVSTKIDFLKLDIEGSENQVVRDLADHDKLRLVEQIVLEYHHHLDTSEDFLGELLTMLEGNGFGYQLHAKMPPPFHRQEFQALMIYAYQVR
jgi:FkbM family methyltransferase